MVCIYSANVSPYEINMLTPHPFLPSVETTWDKPTELMTDEEINATGEWLWVPSESQQFAPAKLISSKGTKHYVKYEDGSEATFSKSECYPFSRSWLKRIVSDLTLLDDMGSPLILHNLRMRFENGDIYTNIGNILISINPYQKLPLYTEEVIRKYKDRKLGAQLPPHVYDVTHDAYYRLTAFKQLQSLVISGESGSGKTEVTKQALQYLAAIAGSKGGIETKVLKANPVLEAFGNAKTLRNDNSSRFGKYMEIFLSNANGEITGASTQNYLLEKIRVVQPSPGERNFHIFYQLCKAAPDDIRKRYKIKPNPADYYYLKSCTDVPTINDEKDMSEVIGAMKELGFSSLERDGLFAVVSAILALGNIKFRETKADQSEVVPDKSGLWLESAAEILQIDTGALANALVTQMLIIPGQAPTTMTLNVDKASNTRHALSKFMYERMFNWLVTRINQTLDITGGEGHKGLLYIGILDIFGFEIFKNNSFEQLCINFTNEMLQQHFNNNTFKLEEKLYVSEGIEWTSIKFIDNQPMIDLITAKTIGVLPLLDEELKVPKGSDKGFLSKLAEKQGKNEKYGRAKSMDPMMFTIKVK
jgi:myosin heavy subunit